MISLLVQSSCQRTRAAVANVVFRVGTAERLARSTSIVLNGFLYTVVRFVLFSVCARNMSRARQRNMNAAIAPTDNRTDEEQQI